MKYLALNGFRHPLDRYFNSNVTCINRFNWTERNAIDFAKTLEEPTTLIGFSDGATAALTIANYSRHVKHVYAHSPEFRYEKVITQARIQLFRTYEDATPTFEDTFKVYIRYTSFLTSHNVTLQTLPPEKALPVRDLATLYMWWKNHQFHNCLPYLPLELLRDQENPYR